MFFFLPMNIKLFSAPNKTVSFFFFLFPNLLTESSSNPLAALVNRRHGDRSDVMENARRLLGACEVRCGASPSLQGTLKQRREENKKKRVS